MAAIARLLEERTPSQIALCWARQQPFGVIIPIIGVRKMSQLEDNRCSPDFEIPEEHLARLDEVSTIEPGFPHDFLAFDTVRQVVFGNTHDRLLNHRT